MGKTFCCVSHFNYYGGNSPDNRQNPWPPRRPDRGSGNGGGGGLDGLMDQLRGFFGGSGGGLGRWILLGVALLVAVGVFPNEGSLANLATVVLLRVTEGWAFRRYMDMAPLWAAEEKPTKIAA